MFVFNNGLEYYVGCNFPMREVYEGAEMLYDEYKMISQFNNPGDLQDYYYNEMDVYRSYKDCEIIWNYMNKNKELIEEIIKEYEKYFD